MADTNFSSGTVIASTWLDDVNTSTYSQLTAVAGTDAITATGPLSMSAYAAGQRFFFIPVANNTGAVTINISGLGVKAITKFGFTSLVAQDLLVGVIAEMAYDGTEFQLINPQTFNLTNVVPITNGGTGATTASQALINLGATGRLIGVQTFTANGTYTPTTGTTRVVVEVTGGGGAGGGSTATAAGQLSIGGGGGAGGFAKDLITSGFSGVAVTVGAGGLGMNGAVGGAGGTSSFGALVQATGGSGGAAGAAGATVVVAGGAGGVGSLGTILNVSGARGGGSFAVFATGLAKSGAGAASTYGDGADGTIGGPGSFFNGASATVIGSGGGGGFSGASGGTQFGGLGAAGVVVVYEYS